MLKNIAKLIPIKNITVLTILGRLDTKGTFNIPTNTANIICATTAAITTEIENMKHFIKNLRFSLDNLIRYNTYQLQVDFYFLHSLPCLGLERPFGHLI
jgi:hypothetical protein